VQAAPAQLAKYRIVGCWSARELQEILGYTKGKKFLNVIEKAKKA
jgi:DNA-damage-inducible protein D